MNVLVTGGAGYVGSVVSEELLKSGYQVKIIDNLQQGHRQSILPEAEFIQADICDVQSLEKVFSGCQIDAVMHMAAETVIEYSMTDPRRFFQQNVIGGINILNAMLKNGVKKLIFSSSAAVYGDAGTTPIEEDYPKIPINSYGESKLMFEKIIDWYARAYSFNCISLRYFNSAGASALLGESHDPETHLIPNVLKAVLYPDNPVSVFGTDYPTRDGTCVRDYVHVVDIAGAHVLALEKLSANKSDKGQARAYNLGNGEGYTVQEVIETASKVTRIRIPVKNCPRRPGDPAVLVASAERVKTELGWKLKHPELEAMVESAWKWLSSHTKGYNTPAR